MTSSTTVADITISAKLIDDSLCMEKTPIATDGLMDRFSVVRNNATTAAVSELVTAAGELLTGRSGQPGAALQVTVGADGSGSLM